MDTAKLERAQVTEAELSRLIEKRSDKSPDPDELEPSYAESVRRLGRRLREERRAAWGAFHLEQAARLERTAAELAEGHRRRAGELLCPE